MSAAVRHVSVRVPWHDRAWDGHVCDDPLGNASCLALRLIAEGRNDPMEVQLAGEAFDDLTDAQIPPCIKASAAFLAPRNHTVQSVMSYSTWSEDHRHMRPKTLHLPAFGAQLIPYRWMLRESGFALAADLELAIDPEREPSEPSFLQNTAWVQHHDHQKALLDAFAEPLVEHQSLVLFYATRTPLCDDERRVLLGAAILEKKHRISEYDYNPADTTPDNRLRAMVWERSVQHSLRPLKGDNNLAGYGGGFVLPYHDILRAAAADETLDPADYVAFAPEDARVQFSYGSEHVSHGATAAALLAARAAFEKIATVLDGPWTGQIEWIDEQLSNLWRLQGPAPGLGVALSTLHSGFNGTLFAIALSGILKPNEDPWPVADEILSGRRDAPSGSPAITSTLQKRWAKVRGDAARYDTLQLLARFELTKDQASRATSRIESSDLLKNPYRLFEDDRDQQDPVAFATVDRGLLPGSVVAEAHPLPGGCSKDLGEYDNRFRLRAATAQLLEEAAGRGNTIVAADRLADEAAALTLTRPLPLDADLLDLFRDEFSPLVEVGPGDKNPTAQLDRYVAYRKLLEKAVKERAAVSTAATTVDWSALLKEKFGSSPGDVETEARAREEKETALARLAGSRIAMLVGPAGTGKTTVLELLLQRPEIVGSRVLLLAPTGKARVRLGTETKRPGEARTIAQFLLAFDRYDIQTNRYAPNPGAAKDGATCCIIDEASMLTEDMLAAVLDALPPTCRIILVGDPYQLPPIGAGCPFVDIIAYLRRHHPQCVAELTVSMRQRGDRSDAQLAAIFSGRHLEPGEDEVAAMTLDGFDDQHLHLRQWESVAELPGLVQSIFQTEFAANEGEDVIANVETSLGAAKNAKGYLNFDSGCSAKAEAWQILSVNRAQAGGSIYLNRLIKDRYRAERLAGAINSNQVSWRKKWFRTVKPQGPEQITYGDKVICVRNHKREAYQYQPGGNPKEKEYIANGEIGLVTGQTAYGHANPKFVNVEFTGRSDRSFGFSRSAFRDDGQPYLELAYAVTVHKAQGSQFGVVILVLPANSRLLSREMIYTALTRQTDRIWILHQGGFDRVLAYRHDAFSDVGARTTNLLRETDPKRTIPPMGLPAGIIHQTRGFLEEHLKHRTIRGEYVSSKSELAIANILYGFEQRGLLTYEVEPPLPFSDNARGRWADFRVTAGEHVWYWEHCGRLDLPSYRNRWARKKTLYRANGFAPWSETSPNGRLIVTEDGSSEGLDSHSIHGLVHKLFDIGGSL
ncbi:AAA family ATPase [Mesorhizobium sp. L103C131B0]|uniref:AAA family ATPase n=1 Tax=Mesorhizobium sp. L103C131B0 TaxID=1287089 RepID=UPI0004103894|nr:AAA family ATPase [Mesorhizobium sp. L103C131B0]